VATALREGGYRTYHVGKWHLGGEAHYPEHHGFDVNVGGWETGGPQGGYFSPYQNPRLPDGPEGEYLPDRLTSEAIQLIEENGTEPFFLYMPFYCVHTPIQAKEEHIQYYESKARKLGLDQAKTFEVGELFPCEHKKTERVKRRLIQSDSVYAAMIHSVDENIGRLLACLEATGDAENTVIIFTSDNGGLATAEGSPTSNAPLAEGKGWMYEGGTREPLIVTWPGHIEAGSQCTVPVSSPDFYPTLLEMAGLDLLPEQHCDGESIMPLLIGGKHLKRDAIFWHYPHYGNQGGTPGSSVRSGDYKLIEFFEDGQIELYNLRDDPGETSNLAQAQPDMVRQLHGALVAWREEVEARIPEANPEFVPWP
jgi:arylsulfatase A-like enzyme